MTITEPPPAVRHRRTAELPRLDSVVAPRWLRQRHRHDAWRAARRDELLDRILRQVAANPAEDREKTIDELLDEQGVQPFDPGRARRLSGLTSKDWDELRTALKAVRGE